MKPSSSTVAVPRPRVVSCDIHFSSFILAGVRAESMTTMELNNTKRSASSPSTSRHPLHPILNLALMAERHGRELDELQDQGSAASFRHWSNRDHFGDSHAGCRALCVVVRDGKGGELTCTIITPISDLCLLSIETAVHRSIDD